MTDTTETRLADLRIQSYLRASVAHRDTEQVGPFLATFDRHSDNPFLNYAIPEDDAVPSSAEVAALIESYRRHHKKPRLEYLPAVAPAAEKALIAGGFTVEGRCALMICAPDLIRRPPAPNGIEFLMATEDRDLAAAAMVQHEAYEGTTPTEEDVNRLRGTVSSGGIVGLARDAATGEPVGAGLDAPAHDGLTEIAAVAVREPFRRRGIAAALTARLAQEAFAAGVTLAFLMAEHEAEERIYTRAGFITTSEVLFLSA
jgi:ribosomal protein S18 acetylase RimI-like enzyme